MRCLQLVNLYRVIDNLISLSESKYDFLKEVSSLTEQQTNAIELSDYNLLLALIDKKQEIIDLISGLDSQFGAIVDDLKTIYDIKSLDELKEESANIALLKETVSKVNDILRKIIEDENINKEKINLSKDELEVKMNTAKTGRVAIKQYSGISTYSDAVFFDRKIK